MVKVEVEVLIMLSHPRTRSDTCIPCAADEVPLAQSPGMKKHAIGVLQTVGTAVAGLNDVKTLIPVLEALGGRHAQYGVQPEHFAI
eukprot:689918-Rhodomonas_salina.1